MLDLILPYEARAEFCQIFCSFFVLLTFVFKKELAFLYYSNTDVLETLTRSIVLILDPFTYV
jgi:Na+-driven multidrug efflux pump